MNEFRDKREAPPKVVLRFLTSPYLWLTLSVLSAITAAITYNWKYPRKEWMVRQARDELIASVVFVCLAVAHYLLGRYIFCLQAAQRFKALLRRWAMKPKIFIPSVLAIVLLVWGTYSLWCWISATRLARQLRTERQSWIDSFPKVPDRENGMLLVLQGLEQLPDELPEKIWDEGFNLKDEPDYALAKELLASNESALRTICSGLAYQKFALPLDCVEGKRPEVYRLYNAAVLMWLSGDLTKQDGKLAEAITDYLNILRLAQTIAKEHSLDYTHDSVFDIGSELVIQTLSEESVGEKHLEVLLRELVRLHRMSGSFYGRIEARYYSFIQTVADLIEGKKTMREVIFCPGFAPDVRIYFSRYSYNYRRDIEAYRVLLQQCREADPGKYYSLPVEFKYQPIREWELTQEELRHPIYIEDRGLLGWIGPGVDVVATSLAVDDTVWRGAIALNAIRLFQARNGRQPDSLPELGELIPGELLIDPFSGNPLVYRVEGDDFCLYSVGLDMVDKKPVNLVPYFREEHYRRFRGVRGSGEREIVFHAPLSR